MKQVEYAMTKIRNGFGPTLKIYIVKKGQTCMDKHGHVDIENIVVWELAVYDAASDVWKGINGPWWLTNERSKTSSIRRNLEKFQCIGK